MSDTTTTNVKKEEVNVKVDTPKKKSKIGVIILIIVLVLCAIVSATGYMIYQKGKDVVTSAKSKVEDIKEDVTEKSNSFEEIQGEIRILTEKGMSGEISQEEFQKELAELQAESLKVQIESAE